MAVHVEVPAARFRGERPGGGSAGPVNCMPARAKAWEEDYFVVKSTWMYPLVFSVIDFVCAFP